ncbi:MULTISPECIES: DUF2127 domain-containing protein [Actibacterium]|uniref:Putative membrane protein n=1 Tax=Actibacterium naphthalenivorans TaxID=1614693 RepID=A0A840CBX8_9RHOB|nr:MULTISPECIES: DUF2127 domain-containing protein [Actibacterium]ALG90547.1 hypothetical protein TQ29_10550 [Actibacterium sp. EMB200-NS6]MBB4023541.1 putative membrane protein [Actibacterium naphthalenivorans]
MLPHPPAGRLRQWLLHEAFEASLLLKGLMALAEITAGIGLHFVPSGGILALADWLTRTVLARDPSGAVAGWLVAQAQGVTDPAGAFLAFYLAAHGALKLAMVGGLAARWRWAYPASIVVLTGFIATQIHRYVATQSPMMIVLTLFDMVVITLIWREYRLMRGQIPS